MSSAIVSVVLAVALTSQVNTTNRFGSIRTDEFDYQKENFQHWWGQELTTKLADLPTEGKVPDFRVPYAGHDYPDRGGGTINAMAKYDQAFNRGNIATSWERRDIEVHRGGRGEDEFRPGLFGRMRRVRSASRVPTWYGHCNGWTAASIRHAEPERSVVKNGVTFTPADIKGLLAEIYMYNPTEHLGGLDDAINPAMLHLTLGNWIGLGSHPVGMEAAMGEVVINYPLYAYKAKVNKLSDRQYEVQNTITYRLNTPREYDKGPDQSSRTMYFHYVLDLDGDGKITGGRYYGDSARIDMLWTPLKPVEGGEKGNERGNPHVSVKEVLALWRASVSEETRKKWLNVDPTEEDRLLPPEEPAPAEATAQAEPTTPAAEGDAAAAESATTAATTEAAATAEAPAAADAPATESPSTEPVPPTEPAPAPETTPENPAPESPAPESPAPESPAVPDSPTPAPETPE